MICNKCGKTNPDTAKFCVGCGNMLSSGQTAPMNVQSQFCKKCGTPLVPNAMFCTNCSTPVNEMNTQQTIPSTPETAGNNTNTDAVTTAPINTVTNTANTTAEAAQPNQLGNASWGQYNNQQQYTPAGNNYGMYNNAPVNQGFNNQTFSGYTPLANSMQSGSSTSKTVTCIIGILLALAGVLFMWIGSFFVYDDTGIAMVDIVCDMDFVMEAFEEIDDELDSSYKNLAIAGMAGFSAMSAVPLIFAILAIVNLATKKQNKSLTKILLSAIFVIVDFAALISMTVFVRTIIDEELDNVADKISIGLCPIICLVVAFILLVSVIVVKARKK